jgi:hypothetical protein
MLESSRCADALERASAVSVAAGWRGSVGCTAVPPILLLLLLLSVGMIVWLLSSNAVPVPETVLAAPQLPLAVLQVCCVAGARGRRRAVVFVMQ